MTTSERFILESPWSRGLDETKPHRLDISRFGAGTYSNPAVEIYDEAGADVSGAVLSGAASIAGTYLTTPDFIADAMTAGKMYLMLVIWQIDGKTVSASGYIDAQQ